MDVNTGLLRSPRRCVSRPQRALPGLGRSGDSGSQESAAHATCQRGASTASPSASRPLTSAAAPSSVTDSCVLTVSPPDLTAPWNCPAATWPWRKRTAPEGSGGTASHNGPWQCPRRPPHLPSVRETPRVTADSAPLYSAHKPQNDVLLQGHDHNRRTANTILVTEAIRSVSSHCLCPAGECSEADREIRFTGGCHSRGLPDGDPGGDGRSFPFQDDTSCL